MSACRFSFALFDMDGHQVPQQMVVEVGDIFKRILTEVPFDVHSWWIFLFLFYFLAMNPARLVFLNYFSCLISLDRESKE